MSFTPAQLEAIEILVGLSISSKEALTVPQLLSEYRSLEGKHLDTTGFKSINDMLRSSQRFELINKDGMTLVITRLTYESLHIVNMVSRQKSANKTKANIRRPPPRPRQNQPPFRPKQDNNRKFQQVRPLNQPPQLKVVQQPKYTPVNNAIYPVQTGLPSNNFLSGQSEAETFTKMDSNNVPVKSPTLMKPSVQDRLAAIKRSVSNEDTKPDKSPGTSENIALQWCATENMSVVARLEQYCNMKKLPPPDYTYYKVKEGKQFKIQCRVTIEDSTYSTYPEDFDTRDQAKIVCAARAVESIKLRQGMARYPLFDGDDDELACKIFDMVNNHKTGVFFKEIPNLFRTTYNLSIPSNFSRIVNLYYGKLFQIERQPALNKDIVYPVENAILPRPASQASFAEDIDPDLLPPHITLPWDQKTWNILITYPETTTAVWCNLLGSDYYDARVEVYDEIELAGLTEHPYEILVNEYYIAEIHQCPQRVQIIEVDTSQNKMFCRFIDTGEQEWLEKDQLFVCDKKFLQLPAQAFPLSLEGVTLFSSLENIDYCFTDLCDKVLIAKVHTNEEQYKKSKRSVIEVTLYDTSTQDDININEQLLEKISDTVLKPVKLNEKINLMVITYISDTGIISGYLKDAGHMNLIKQEIKRIVANEAKMKEYQGITGSEHENEVYLVYDKTLAHYVRVKPVKLDVTNLDVIVVHLIDYGTELTVNKHELYRLHSLSKGLSIIPPQAIQMRLHGVTNIEDQYIISLLRGILKPDTAAHVKVNEFTIDAKEPSVSIFFRSAKYGLICLNDAITSQSGLSPHNTSDVDLNVSPVEFISNEFVLKKVTDQQPINTSELPKVLIPDIKHDFGVRVIISQSPQMFFVQPRSFQKQFQQLIAKMKTYYETTKSTLDSAGLEENAVYAAYRQETKEWCRAKLLTRYSEDHIKVHFSDYACIDVVSLKDLRELPNDFRLLPEQAIQAKLFGVKPNSTTGFTSAAAHRFIHLTRNKKFDAVLMGIERIPDTFERVIILDLIMRGSDGKSDVHIREILIKEQLVISSIDDIRKKR